jgi:hypothetical protein
MADAGAAHQFAVHELLTPSSMRLKSQLCGAPLENLPFFMTNQACSYSELGPRAGARVASLGARAVAAHWIGKLNHWLRWWTEGWWRW